MKAFQNNYSVVLTFFGGFSHGMCNGVHVFPGATEARWVQSIRIRVNSLIWFYLVTLISQLKATVLWVKREVTNRS